MMYAFKETYNSAMEIPIPIRKWLIERYNKQKLAERPKDKEDTTRPLSQLEKERLINKSKKAQNPKSSPQAPTFVSNVTKGNQGK